MAVPPSILEQPLPPMPSIDALELRLNLEKAMKFPDFRSMRRKHECERDRYQEYYRDVKAVLRSRQNEARCRVLKRHAEATHKLVESHPQQLTTLEERHLEAELSLKEAQVHESRTCLVALRHMEGYCQGHDPSGTGRIVTLQDRMKLERQYHTWRHLSRRQDTAINILREQQARQLKMRATKQSTEVAALGRMQAEEGRRLEGVFEQERRVLEAGWGDRRERLVRRWDVAFETWRGWRGKEEHLDVPGRVEPLKWVEV